MKNYTYIARDLAGQRKQGVREAACSNDVLAWLRERDFTPISVSELAQAAVQKKRTSGRKKKIKSGELAALCWQLTTMVEGGVPITTALDTASQDLTNLQLQEVLQQIVEKMHKGQSFSESVAEYPKVFNQLARAMLLAGETGGDLPGALRRLADYFENRDQLARKVKGAIAYPVFVLVFIVLIVVFIMAFIIPRFRAIFDQIGGKLPAFTQAFMNFYDNISNNLIAIIGIITFVSIFLVTVTTKTKKGHYWFSRIMLSAPLFGRVFREAFVSIFCRTMSTLLAAGVSVLEVLDILSTMTGNDIIKDAITSTRTNIVQGSNIAASMTNAGFFPHMLVKMMQVGEESGALPKVLDRTAVYYERRVDALITTMMALLEPLMIVIVGAIVLVVVLALYLPIFSMSNV